MKLPKKARRVFKGVIFDVYQWRQKLFDGSMATFEMLKRPDTVQILAVCGDKILGVSEEQPGHRRVLGFLGGRVDRVESALAGAKRELLEEACLSSNDWELFQTYESFSKIDWKVYFYIARNCRKTAKPKPEVGEKIRIRAFSFAQFMALYTSGEYHGGEFVADLLRLQNDTRLLKNFKNKLFGGKSHGH